MEVVLNVLKGDKLLDVEALKVAAVDEEMEEFVNVFLGVEDFVLELLDREDDDVDVIDV